MGVLEGTLSFVVASQDRQQITHGPAYGPSSRDVGIEPLVRERCELFDEWLCVPWVVTSGGCLRTGDHRCEPGDVEWKLES